MRKQRESSVTKRCRLLCPHGCGTQKVVEVGEPHILECGHSRGELLPLKPGRVSIEHLRQKIGASLFPAVLSREDSGGDVDTAHDPEITEVAMAVCHEAFEEFENATTST
jgi:hypothetical protein